jgi:hypothetical protein
MQVGDVERLAREDLAEAARRESFSTDSLASADDANHRGSSRPPSRRQQFDARRFEE